MSPCLWYIDVIFTMLNRCGHQRHSWSSLFKLSVHY